MNISPGRGAVQPGCIAARMPRDFVHRLLTACGETHVSAETGETPD